MWSNTSSPPSHKESPNTPPRRMPHPPTFTTPPAHNQEAYIETNPPPPYQSLQGFCDANWGSQIGNAANDGANI